jgi:hypothetical protein
MKDKKRRPTAAGGMHDQRLPVICSSYPQGKPVRRGGGGVVPRRVRGTTYFLGVSVSGECQGYNVPVFHTYVVGPYVLPPEQ